MIFVAIWLRLVVHLLAFEPTSEPILVENLRNLAPYLDVATAHDHVEAAKLAASLMGLEPELLLGMARVESHYDPSWTSHISDDTRMIKRWPSKKKLGKGPRFCGVLQTQARYSWQACLALRDLETGYLVGALELRQWLRYSRGDLRRALNGYGCGVKGMKEGCRFYGQRVLGFASKLSTRTRAAKRPLIAF